MDFELTGEQKMLQKTAYEFAVKEFEPLAKECDREEKYPEKLLAKASGVGFIGCFFPEEYGGAEYGFFELALITEQFCRVDMGLDTAIMSSTFGSENILFFGTKEQKAKYLPPIAEGKVISAGAYTEPNAGTDVVGMQTTAVKDGNEYVITGNKMFITNGTICDFMVVLCVTNPEEKKAHKRLSLILVESDRKGVKANKIHGKMGIRASDTAEVVFDEVRVPCENLIGQEGRGFYQVMHFFDITRTRVAAQGVGIAQGALEKVIKHVKQRHTFGKPISSNQAIQFEIAEMATKVELARTLTYRAAWMVDNNKTDMAINAMAKYFAAETAVFVCNKALQFHGGYGYIDEYDVQRFYRDAKILEIYEGAKEAEKMTIASTLF